MSTGSPAATSCANRASARAPTAMSCAAPEAYVPPPVLTWTMPSAPASTKPSSAALSVAEEVTFTAGYA
jgi:hypothetical protein